MPLEPHREYCRRQHRLLAHHLGIEAWRSGADCLWVEREQLEEFLRLQRLKSARIEWLLEDVRPWFPHVHPVYAERAEESLRMLYLSRFPLEPRFIVEHEDVDVEELLVWMRGQGLRIQQLSALEPPLPLTEEQVIPRLALLASGLAEP